MLKKLQSTLQDKCLLNTLQPLVVGVSGGPDSLCLLEILHSHGYKLIIAHLDHCLRPESGADASAVQAMAEERGLPFILETSDVHAYADEHRLSIEEAARTQRYRFLFRVAGEHNAQAVAVGHNADDQVETVLMHLLRGAGLDGLKGMTYRSKPNAWSESIPLVRPLLGLWREQIMEYLLSNELVPLEDSSNVDTRFYRNRLRHELIPYLEDYNPGIRERTWRMADLLTEDHALLEALTENAWSRSILDLGAGYLAIDHTAMSAQPIGLQRRLLRRAITRLRPGLRDLDYDAVARALAFIVSPSTSDQIDLIAGLRLMKEGQRLWLAAWEADLPRQDWPQMPTDAELTLKVPGKLNLGGGWMLRAEIVEDIESGHAKALVNDDPYQAWLDLDSLQTPLRVRTRRAGDRLKPLGMEGKSMKLAEFMVNIKLPRRARDRWPLVTSGEEIAWATGLRLAHPLRVTTQTNQLLRLILERQQHKDNSSR